MANRSTSEEKEMSDEFTIDIDKALEKAQTDDLAGSSPLVSP